MAKALVNTTDMSTWQAQHCDVHAHYEEDHICRVLTMQDWLAWHGPVTNVTFALLASSSKGPWVVW
jgi:hypothetical protein